MHDGKKSSTPAVVESLTTITVAATAAAAPPAALAAAGLAVLPKALGVLVDKALRWKEADAAAFWDRLLHDENADGITSEEIAGLIEAHADEPFVRENVLRSVRTLLESVDPCIIVPLATLARQCIRDKIAPDAFSRNTMRLFTELGRDEFADLRRLLAWILEETRIQPAVMIRALFIETDQRTA